ncbi:hypothetical protein DRN74_03300 [Candidatus Micrarchaeota archaeon]|nr:MAG: hypothetical protein DRN74_03300 [Candidatus Micrarchaeota archaeon]
MRIKLFNDLKDKMIMMREAAVKCRLADVKRHSRVNVLGKVRSIEGDDIVGISLEDESASVKAKFTGWTRLMAKEIKEGDLAIVIGKVEGDELVGEIIKKVYNPKYQVLRQLEIKCNEG